MKVQRWMRAALLISAAIAVASCGEPTSPPPPTWAELVSETPEAPGPALLRCPSDASLYGLAIAGPNGSVSTTGPVTLNIPPGAVRGLTLFLIAVPRSRHMEIAISAFGHRHFEFDQPVEVTLDYSRCEESALEDGPVSAWFIDPVFNRALEPMEGDDQRDQRRVTFTIRHLSGYALAQ